MIACADAPSWVEVVLDTHPPLLTIEAPSQVEPPDEWIVVVRSDEPVGHASFLFEDSLGGLHGAPYARVDSMTLRVLLPTVGLPSASGRLLGTVVDQACNPASFVLPVEVLRPRPYDATLTITHGYEVDMTLDKGFDSEIEMSHGFDAAGTIDHAFETQQTFEEALSVILEVDHGN